MRAVRRSEAIKDLDKLADRTAVRKLLGLVAVLHRYAFGQTSKTGSKPSLNNGEAPANLRSAEVLRFRVDEFRARVAELIGGDQRERAKQRRAESVRTSEKLAEPRIKLTHPLGTR